MTNQQVTQDQDQDKDTVPAPASANGFDGLKDKKPEDLTPEELRLMADTMPGDGPGD
ncbi:hypothetical protein ACFPOU_19595 [Massilia jejuensis]|uniref:Uncharacterized protein n=1 Tax=Massilia jejuensis TaxID=648894 RepID=A0ABW0PKT9_9BURK